MLLVDKIILQSEVRGQDQQCQRDPKMVHDTTSSQDASTNQTVDS